MKVYIKEFFRKLELYEDIHNSKKHKADILSSVSSFLDKGSEDTARQVYNSFFKAYWIGIQNKINPFLELTKIVKEYEENAGRLIYKQRDHYVHSVYVFLLGIAIFCRNKNVRSSFETIVMNKESYPDSYDTRYEEFFYRWGLSALFHDIAYPIEITLQQANRYFQFVWDYPKKISRKNTFIDLPGFERFISLPSLKPLPKYAKEYYKKYPLASFIQKYDNAITLLSKAIGDRFNVNYQKVEKNLWIFVKEMKKEKFIDHGFYGAVIMLRWYYHLLKVTKWNPAYFYFSVLDSAKAILLHNLYKRRFIKHPMLLGKLRITTDPISFLLILCDEIQDWDRETYGKGLANVNFPVDVDIMVNNDELVLKYKYAKGVKWNSGLLERKKREISKVLKVEDVFKKGLRLN